jgi:PleD family two-component response regulator
MPAELDAALAGVAQVLQRTLRTVDVVGRCDAYDCAVVLPAASFAGTRAVVARLEQQLGELLGSGTIPPTVDIHLGVTLTEGYENLLARSSQRLVPLQAAD